MKAENKIDLVAFFLRLTLGSIMFFYGLQKGLGLFGGLGLPATAERLTAVAGIPAEFVIFGYAAVAAELFGGIALILGLLTPLAALGILSTMGVATYVNWSRVDEGASQAVLMRLFIEGTPDLASRTFYTVALLMMALAILITGPGKFSLDARLFRKKSK